MGVNAVLLKMTDVHEDYVMHSIINVVVLHR